MARVVRADLGSQILPDEVSEVLLRGAAEQSLIQRYARSRPMSANTVKLTEAEISGANVFWVGEGARKSTSGVSVSSKTWSMSAEELAVIVPIDENLQDDASIDLFELFAPSIETAIAQKLDAAALFGTSAPAGWTHSIVAAATTAGHSFEEDADPTTDERLAQMTAAIDAIEEDGYAPNHGLVRVGYRPTLRNMKDLDGRFLFGGPNGASLPNDLFGVDIDYVKSDVWDNAVANIVFGDFDQAILGTRQGVKYKVFDQGVITDGAGEVVYSLMEQDMIALRVTARYAFKIIADDTADGETLASGEAFPFAVVAPLIP
jgi:HK97 family phage major capsid protein